MEENWQENCHCYCFSMIPQNNYNQIKIFSDESGNWRMLKQHRIEDHFCDVHMIENKMKFLPLFSDIRGFLFVTPVKKLFLKVGSCIKEWRMISAKDYIINQVQE
jgi:hypothetical protein